MSHQSGTVIIGAGMLHIFDPAEYANVREHFTTTELTKIDELRALPETHDFSGFERAFVIYALSKVIVTAD